MTQQWLGTFWCEGLQRGVSLYDGVLHICDVGSGEGVLHDVKDILRIARPEGEEVLMLETHGGLVSLRGENSEVVYKAEVALRVEMQNSKVKASPPRTPQPPSPAITSNVMDVVVPSMPPFLPFLYLHQSRLMIKQREKNTALGLSEKEFVVPADTDFWMFFRLSTQLCDYSDDPPYYLVTASHTGESIRVNKDFLFSYTEAWKEANRHVITVTPTRGCGGDEVSFRAAPAFWEFIVHDLRRHLPHDSYTLRVSSSCASGSLNTTPVEWNNIVENWERQQRCTTLDKRELVNRLAKGLHDKPRVAPINPVNSVVKSVSKPVSSKKKKGFWESFVDEWDRSDGEILPRVGYIRM
eukprot:TRINITY_DN481_c2_g2_i1.p1 TRINITY_DN481_c2_g2~~TRINITY_DN481_c2_g2_i1.p1  ORF type:complete len:353 (+),score=68.12 TRINITY_DN481_c2_g2_i1:74-1132(+)